MSHPYRPAFKTRDEIKAMEARIRADMAAINAACPWPAQGGFAKPQQVNILQQMLQHSRQHVVDADGCAIVSFKVGEEGSVIEPEVVQAAPVGTGAEAIAVIEAEQFARGETPDVRFAMRVAFMHDAAGRLRMTEDNR